MFDVSLRNLFDYQRLPIRMCLQRQELELIGMITDVRVSYDETSWIPSANLTWLTVDNHHFEKVTIFSGYVSLQESSCFVEIVLPNRCWTWNFAANIFRLAVLCRSCVDPIVFMSKGMTASPQKPIKLDRFTTTSRRDVTWFMVL